MCDIEIQEFQATKTLGSSLIEVWKVGLVFSATDPTLGYIQIQTCNQSHVIVHFICSRSEGATLNIVLSVTNFICLAKY